MFGGLRILPFLMACAALLVTAPNARAQTPRILAMGDSLMAAHAVTGRSIADYVGKDLGIRVRDQSVLGAHMIYRLPLTGALGLSIPAQYRKGAWDWVVMNGGGNDLWLGCGCNRCDRRMNRLISSDGTRGAIPKLWARIRAGGAKVVYVGYLRSPGIDTPIEHCKNEGDELEARIARLAERVDGIYYLSNQDLVPAGDTSYFGLDGIHPSIKASREIGARVAALLRQLQ